MELVSKGFSGSQSAGYGVIPTLSTLFHVLLKNEKKYSIKINNGFLGNIFHDNVNYD